MITLGSASPDEGLGVVVVGRDEAVDGFLQGNDRRGTRRV